MLRACAEAGQARAAQSLSRMLRNGVEPSSFHFGNVISACARGGELRRVMMYMTRCSSATPARQEDVHDAPLRVRARTLNRALSLIQRLEVAPDVATYNVLSGATSRASLTSSTS